MWKKLVQMTTGPRALLRKVLALNDSPHAIALGVAIGIFVGLTPTVGIQTILILGLVFATRKFMYFNATAAMASTYVSNPVTMVPMYYGWYRIGAWFYPSSLTAAEFEQLLQFEGFSGWLAAMQNLGSQVALPMCLGALITASIGVAIAYPTTYFLVKSFRNRQEKPPSQSEKAVSDPQEVPKTHTSTTSEDAPTDSQEASSATADRRTAKPKTARTKPLLSS